MSSSASTPGHKAAGGDKKAAGAFDVRNIIGGLIGLYGLVLLVLGLIGPSEDDLTKTGGFNANLWVGLGMLAAGVGFILWSRVRPIVVAPQETGQEQPGR